MGLALSVREARVARAAKRAEAQVLGERASDPSSGKGSSGRMKGTARRAGGWPSNDSTVDRVVVSIERVVRVDGVEEIEMGEERGDAARAGREKGEVGAGGEVDGGETGWAV